MYILQLYSSTISDIHKVKTNFRNILAYNSLPKMVIASYLNSNQFSRVCVRKFETCGGNDQ